MALNLVGQRFGRLTVLEQIARPPFMVDSDRWYRCGCDCGNVVDVRSSCLRKGATRSCGCLKDKNPILPGQRFGRLTVLEKVETPVGENRGKARYKCRCDCGNVVVKAMHNLKSGGTRSCGCLHSETGRRNLADWKKKKENKED